MGRIWNERYVVLLEHYGLNSCHYLFLPVKQIILMGYLKLKQFVQLLIMKFMRMSVAFLTADQTLNLLTTVHWSFLSCNEIILFATGLCMRFERN